MVVIEKIEDLVDAILIEEIGTLLYLSPSLDVIPSRNS